MSRPSTYTDVLADLICDRIADGESLRAICNDDAMPDRRTVLRWLADPEHTTFATKHAHAREMQGDLMDVVSSDDAFRPIGLTHFYGGPRHGGGDNGEA